MSRCGRKLWLPVLSCLGVGVALGIFWLAEGDRTHISPSLSGTPVEGTSTAERYPSDWGWWQRTFPYGRAEATAHLQALDSAREMRLALSESRDVLTRRSASAVWAFAGPTNIGGRVSDIAFSPQKPEVVYAGAATGGVFKSEDGGRTWRPIFDEQAVLNIGDLAVDPVDPQVIYVGTGEANGGHNNFPGAGMYKSTDGGETWRHVGLAHTASIGRVVVDPHNPQRVFVAAVGSYFAPNPERGVYRSDDAGETWQKVLFVSDSTGAIDLVVNPENPSIVYAALWERVRRPDQARLYGATSGVYRSQDGGDTWEPLGAAHGLPNTEITKVGRIGLALCAGQPEVLYALFNDGTTYTGLYRSSDAGDTWVNVDPDQEVLRGTGWVLGQPFSWYFGQVRVHPTDPDRIFVLDVAFMRSMDGGDAWSRTFGQRNLHVDHHALAFHPEDPDYLIDGHDGGISISTDGGASWTRVVHLPVTQFYEIGLDATHPERLYGGTQDNGTLQTLSGDTGDWREILGGDGFYVLVDPTNPDVIYAEWQFGGLHKSTDGGNSFFPARSGIDPSEPTNWSTPVVMDPNSPQVLYYGTDRVYRSENGAQTWAPISPRLSDRPSGSKLGTVTTMAVAPTDSAVLYAGTDDGHLWVTDTGGESWRDISAGLPYRWVTRVAVDPTDAATAYVTFSGLKWKDPQPHVFRTTDQGEHWRDISGNLPDAPVNALAVDPVDPRVVYIGTDVGAFVTFDAGESWRVLGTGLPLVSVYDLKVHPAEHVLVAGTHGRSMYTLDLAALVTDVPSSPVAGPKTFELQQNFPNPFNPQTTIRYTLFSEAHVTMKIYNLRGAAVRTLIEGHRPAGSHAVTWDGRDHLGQQVSSGVYVYRMTADEFSQARTMLLVK